MYINFFNNFTMINKQTWIKHRQNGTIDLEHLHFGLNLNPTINFSINNLEKCLSVINLLPHFIRDKSLKEIHDDCKLFLDKHFNITTLHKDGVEIKIIK